MTEIIIRSISTEEARPLRRGILRPDPALTIDFPRDEDPKTLHLGAFLNRELVGVATVCRGAPLGDDRRDAWQLRAIGVREGVRGNGIGKALICNCLEYVSNQGGKMLWASGRTEVLPFYNALGFKRCGEEYVTETGPHYLVLRDV